MALMCEVCPDPEDCQCGPCPCQSCRHARGETTGDERRALEARDRAFAKADARAAAREASKDMGAALRRYNGEGQG